MKELNHITKELLNSASPSSVICTGTITNTPGEDGIYMTDERVGDKLKYVVKRGVINDFAVYVGWDNENTFEWVERLGQKIYYKDNLLKMGLSNEVIDNHYRF